MDIKEKIIEKEEEINIKESELKDINIKINQNKNEIIPVIVDDIKNFFTNNAYRFFIDSKKDIDVEKVKILKSETESAINNSIDNLTKELNESKSWNFAEGKEQHESIRNDSLSANKGLWKIIRVSSKSIDEVFKKFDFEPVNYYKDIYTYENYTSPYGLSLYDLSSIYGHPQDLPDRIKLLLNDYWKNISKYFSLIAELIRLNEDLRQLKRQELWGNG